MGKDVCIVGEANFGSEPYLVTIGDNVIIGAGSIVNTDVPSNTVAAGSPCKVICTLDEYIQKHQDDFLYMVHLPYEEKKKFLLKHFGLK